MAVLIDASILIEAERGGLIWSSISRSGRRKSFFSPCHHE